MQVVEQEVSMVELQGKRVLITGAASGIGRSTAIAFAGEGCRLILVDIDQPGLDSIEAELCSPDVDCQSYVVDVSSHKQVREMASAIESDLGGVDVLVNVAGVAVIGDMVDTTVEDWEWVIGVNLWGPINTISALLPGMIERKNGHILNVASLGGLVSHGLLLAYCTTKFGLVGLSEALYQQVREHNVHVTAFCPGIIRTPIAEHTKLRGYSSDKVSRWIKILMKSPVTMSADRTGDLIVLAVKKKRPLVVTTVLGKFMAALHRLSPGLVRFIMTKAHRMDNATLR